ncbi:urea ABC transporter ATP-binding subunit UrtE [Phaeobacter inhibens]|uniref:urea ABC transporter ATP-binding subunit UrtE n=1 Tax=Phaeobacter inhibens TaxID=221822 RepID=UPI00041B57C1|nr:urea ABC transporter ATP-binding subunit UrtE [Phaeobacter inhibens]AUQ60167.1 putative urea transport ATP-binding protein UrtE [Phaeobacter inhibens]AUQ64208.1 putative urea transport ATP-binding protein UrtE [Phaeobacter inhibens]AUQ67998.1 putative urea transport ATP-binding protein UrtE [Phaeobacter inhibens]AUQ72144.1 putative urea transport ATP-binding protein UrtE [Phaeobacter inhibens]AUQ84112.1 putative urea transport ATP-binding protein UrtE [Phaeobacter inhibens]
MLKLDDVTLHYGHSQVLHGISMEVLRGEVTCVMGTNGVGKTSLMKAIAGRHTRSGGIIELDGRSLGTASAHQLAKNGIAYVPQGREIFPLLTVLENLETGFGCLPQAERHVPDRIYDLFPVLHDMRHRRGGDLSGGQQQQLAIARALITRPKLLLLDEPTEGIQPNIIQQIGEVIRHLRSEGEMAIVLVEQYFDFAYELADRFVVLRQGCVTLAGGRDDVSRADLLAGVSV